jgi:hypothetical protein
MAKTESPPAHSVRPNQFALLGQRRFAPFFWTQFSGAGNDNVFKFAFTVLVTYQLQVAWLPPQMAGLVIGALFILPYVLFSATSGQLADRWDKARLMRMVKNLEIAIMLLAAYGFLAADVPVLLLCTFLMGCHSTLFGPAKFAYLPQVLREDELVGGILSHLRPAVTVVRWSGRDGGSLERVTSADLVIVAPDAMRVSEAPSGPRHELRVGPLGDEARILGHRSLRDKRRIELGLSPSTPLILGTGANVTAVVNALTASGLHGVPLWWIDDPAHFKVTEQLATEVAAGSRPELQGVFASHDRSTLGAADFLIADSVETLDSSFRDFAELSGVHVLSAADAPELIAGFDSADLQNEELRASRIRHAEETIDAGAAATALLKLVGPQGMNLSGDHHDN